MASVVFHAYNQIRDTGTVRLFRSHNPLYNDGEQLRDFIYVPDVADICKWLMFTDLNPENGLYNVGTGKAATFKALVQAIFCALHVPESIDYIDTPLDIRDKYQYFTEADMTKLLQAGYTKPFYDIENGVHDYVINFLKNSRYF